MLELLYKQPVDSTRLVRSHWGRYLFGFVAGASVKKKMSQEVSVKKMHGRTKNSLDSYGWCLPNKLWPGGVINSHLPPFSMSADANGNATAYCKRMPWHCHRAPVNNAVGEIYYLGGSWEDMLTKFEWKIFFHNQQIRRIKSHFTTDQKKNVDQRHHHYDMPTVSLDSTSNKVCWRESHVNPHLHKYVKLPTKVLFPAWFRVCRPTSSI